MSEMSDIEMSPSADSTADDKDTVYDVIQSDSKTPGELLDEFCSKNLNDINTTIPDPVILHLMKKSGFIANDPKLVKLVSIASQKFLSEIINDCMQYHKLKASTSKQQQTQPQNNAQQTSSQAASNQTQNTNQDKKSAATSAATNNNATLTLDDLSYVLQDYGINVKKPYYFT